MTEQHRSQMKKFKASIEKLSEVLKRDLTDDDIILDATIQRFEFTYENAWKAIKQVLKFKGDDCLSPRDCIKKAYKYGWITKEDVFLELLECRNLTAHTYNLNVALKVYSAVKKNHLLFSELYNKLEEALL
jgi:nucleotidyltransferase substrate binding protein (TIGR01987 family)